MERRNSSSERGRRPEEQNTGNRQETSPERRQWSIERRQWSERQQEENDPYRFLSQVTENPQQTYETRLEQLRPHLSERFLNTMNRITDDLEQPLQTRINMLNIVDRTRTLSVMERREANQQYIDHAPEEGREELAIGVVTEEMDHLLDQTRGLSAMEQLETHLPWIARVPSIEIMGVVPTVLASSRSRLREETTGIPDGERTERQYHWLNCLPDQYRLRQARLLAPNDLGLRALGMRGELQALLTIDNDGQRQDEWRRMKEMPNGVSTYITPEIQEWGRGQREIIGEREIEMEEENERAGSIQGEHIRSYLNTAMREYTLQEITRTLDEVNRHINQPSRE